MMDDFEDYMRDKRAERVNHRKEFWKEFLQTGVVVAGLAALIASATLAAPVIRAFFAA